VSCQLHAPTTLTPERRPGTNCTAGCQSPSGLVRKISFPPGFDPRTVQPLASRYTNYASYFFLIPHRFFLDKPPRNLHETGSPDRDIYDSYSTLLCTGVQFSGQGRTARQNMLPPSSVTSISFSYGTLLGQTIYQQCDITVQRNVILRAHLLHIVESFQTSIH
jgi:hypothetical protein